MATRRRRPATSSTDQTLAKIPDGSWEDFGAEAPVLDKIPDGSWEDFSSEAPDESASVEAFLAAAAADTFEALQASEEAKGLDNFFDPKAYSQEVDIHLPAVVVPPKKRDRSRLNAERVITRRRKS